MDDSSKGNGKQANTMPEIISLKSFGIGSLSVFSLGMVGGVYRVMQKNKGHGLGSRATHGVIAAKALIYGTALCFGAFSGTLALFAYVSNITTGKELEASIKNTTVRYFPGFSFESQYEAMTEEAKAETDQIETDLNNFIKEYYQGEDEDSEDSEENETKETKEHIDDNDKESEK